MRNCVMAMVMVCLSTRAYSQQKCEFTLGNGEKVTGDLVKFDHERGEMIYQVTVPQEAMTRARRVPEPPIKSDPRLSSDTLNIRDMITAHVRNVWLDRSKITFGPHTRWMTHPLCPTEKGWDGMWGVTKVTFRTGDYGLFRGFLYTKDGVNCKLVTKKDFEAIGRNPDILFGDFKDPDETFAQLMLPLRIK